VTEITTIGFRRRLLQVGVAATKIWSVSMQYRLLRVNFIPSAGLTLVIALIGSTLSPRKP
jgi:hypothetical protein